MQIICSERRGLFAFLSVNHFLSLPSALESNGPCSFIHILFSFRKKNGFFFRGAYISWNQHSHWSCAKYAVIIIFNLDPRRTGENGTHQCVGPLWRCWSGGWPMDSGAARQEYSIWCAPGTYGLHQKLIHWAHRNVLHICSLLAGPCATAQRIFLILPSATANTHRAPCTLAAAVLLIGTTADGRQRTSYVDTFSLFYTFSVPPLTVWHSVVLTVLLLFFCLVVFFGNRFRWTWTVNGFYISIFPQCMWCRAMVSMTPIKWISEPRNSFENWKITQLNLKQKRCVATRVPLANRPIHRQRTHAQIIHIACADERRSI